MPRKTPHPKKLSYAMDADPDEAASSVQIQIRLPRDAARCARAYADANGQAVSGFLAFCAQQGMMLRGLSWDGQPVPWTPAPAAEKRRK